VEWRYSRINNYSYSLFNMRRKELCTYGIPHASVYLHNFVIIKFVSFILTFPYSYWSSLKIAKQRTCYIARFQDSRYPPIHLIVFCFFPSQTRNHSRWMDVSYQIGKPADLTAYAVHKYAYVSPRSKHQNYEKVYWITNMRVVYTEVTFFLSQL